MFKKINWWKSINNKTIHRECEEIEYGDILMGEYYVIDVRSKIEYREGHLNGSVNIPLKELKKRIEKMQPDKEKKMLVYCQSGIRSKKAVRILNGLGYQNVCHLKGGLENI